MIKRKLLDKGCCENDRWNKFKDLWSRAWMCVNKINGITPDGDNNFTIIGGDSITVTPEGNGVRISSDGGSDVKSLNGKKGNIVLETNDSAIEVTSNDDHTIGVQLADWVFDELGSFTTDINDLKDDVTTLQNESKVKTINNVTPNVNGNITIGHGGGLLIRENPSTNSIAIQMDSTTYAKIQKVDTLEIDVNTLQNESKVKTINNINPTTSGEFSITAGSNVTITPTTNGVEIASSGGGTSSQWERYTGGTNWVTGGLFNDSRIALKDILLTYNVTASTQTNLYLRGQIMIPKGMGLDLIASMVLTPYGNWCNDKLVANCYLATGTSDIYNSLTGTSMKTIINYSMIDRTNNTISNVTTVNPTIPKTSIIVHFK